jgi:hypothetical protein
MRNAASFDPAGIVARVRVLGMQDLYHHRKIREIAATLALTHGNAAIRAPIMGETVDTRRRWARIRLGLVLRRSPSQGLLASAGKPRHIDVTGISDGWLYAGVVDTIEVVFEIVCTAEDFEKTGNIFKTPNLLAPDGTPAP